MSKKYLLYFFLVIALSGFDAQAQLRGAYAPIGVGARAASLGGAATALVQGPENIYYNPAGVYDSSRQIQFMQFDPMKLGISYNWLAVTQPIGKYNLGFAWNGLDAEETLGFPYKEGCYTLTLAGNEFAHRPLNWGVSGKLYYFEGGSEELSSNMSGIGLDAGLLWEKDRITIGWMMRDFYTSLTGSLRELEDTSDISHRINPSLIMGVAWKQTKKINWVCDLELLGSLSLNSGIEYTLNQNVALRGGLNSDGKISLGFGITSGGIMIDYSYVTQAVDDNQRVSVKLKF